MAVNVPANLAIKGLPANEQPASKPPGVLPAASFNKKINALTSLRFFACCFMVLYHSQEHFWGSQCVIDHNATTTVLAFFFTLSGFVIAYNYSHIKDTKSVCLFYLARYARIWPTHVLVLMLFVFLIPEVFKIQSSALPVFLSNLFLVHAWIPSSQFFFSYNAPSWSSSTEIFFYLAFPLLLLVMRKKWYLSLLLATVPLLLLICVCNVFKLPHAIANGASVPGLISIHPLSRLFDFFVGMVTALLVQRNFQRLKLTFIPATVLEVTALSCMVLVALQATTWRSAWMPIFGDAGSLWLEGNGIPALSCAFLLCVLATESGGIARLLNYPLLVLLGEISFVVYVLHSLLLTYQSVYFSQHTSLQSCLLFWATIVVAGHFIWSVFDTPTRKLMLKVGTALIERRTLSTLNGSLFWQKPFAPKAFMVNSAEACLLLLLLWYGLPAPHFVSTAVAGKLADNCTVKAVDFGQYLRCKGARAQKAANNTVRLKLVWEALQPENIDFFMTVYVFNGKQEVIGCATHSLDPRRDYVPASTCWSEDFTVPVARVDEAQSVIVGVLRKRKPMPTNLRQPAMTIPIQAGYDV